MRFGHEMDRFQTNKFNDGKIRKKDVIGSESVGSKKRLAEVKLIIVIGLSIKNTVDQQIVFDCFVLIVFESNVHQHFTQLLPCRRLFNHRMSAFPTREK